MTMSAKVTWHGRAATAAERRGAARGLHKAVEHVLQQANTLVPIDQKGLIDSGNTDVDENELRGSIYYDTLYAARQHEELTWQHEEGKTAKYLETPLNREKSTTDRLIANEIKREL